MKESTRKTLEEFADQNGYTFDQAMKIFKHYKSDLGKTRNALHLSRVMGKEEPIPIPEEKEARI